MCGPKGYPSVRQRDIANDVPKDSSFKRLGNSVLWLGRQVISVPQKTLSFLTDIIMTLALTCAFGIIFAEETITGFYMTDTRTFKIFIGDIDTPYLRGHSKGYWKGFMSGAFGDKDPRSTFTGTFITENILPIFN